MAFQYIHGPGLILLTLARAKFRYPEFTPIEYAARRETSRQPSLRDSRHGSYVDTRADVGELLNQQTRA